MESLAEKAHLAREPNHDAVTLAAFYSRALDYWGVEMQKSGQLTNAAAHFERALELNPDNLVAQVNLECNKNLQAGRKSAVQVSKSIEDEFGKYRNWDEIIGENGPFDEPNFCYEQGRVFVSNTSTARRRHSLTASRTLAPENLAARTLAQPIVCRQWDARRRRSSSSIRSARNPACSRPLAPTGRNCSSSKPPPTWPRTTSEAQKPPCRRRCGSIPGMRICWPPRHRCI